MQAYYIREKEWMCGINAPLSVCRYYITVFNFAGFKVPICLSRVVEFSLYFVFASIYIDLCKIVFFFISSMLECLLVGALTGGGGGRRREVQFK